MNLHQTDPEIKKLIDQELERQQSQLNLIPSENFTSAAVREAVASPLMHKYSEGNIGKRYYEGNQNIDEIEALAISRAKELFKLPDDWDANVQALSGSNANIAALLAVATPGDTILSMFLYDGGHLSHGWSYDPDVKHDAAETVYLPGKSKIHAVAKLFNIVQYKTNPQTHLLDYDLIEKAAIEHKPQVIITGGTAYPRDIDYKRMKQIAETVGAIYLADIAHEAGLIGAGVMPSPVGIADIVTLTTHKTLRSARGAIIFAHRDLIKKINRAILPGLQGGPFNNNIAGIAVGLGEALKPEFKEYAAQVIQNAQALATELSHFGFELISGGTDKHLVLIDMTNKGIFGKFTAKALAEANIIGNMNTMPGETRTPIDPSAIRLGTPFVTTQGMKEPEMKQIAELINRVIEESKQWWNLDFEPFMEEVKKSAEIKKVGAEATKLAQRFPLPN